MTNLVERVARALCREDSVIEPDQYVGEEGEEHPRWEDFRPDAITAVTETLEAMMEHVGNRKSLWDVHEIQSYLESFASAHNITLKELG